MDDQSRQRGGDETWFRLRDWTKGQKASERLTATLLQTEGFSAVDPSHPLGGKDGGKDGLCRKDGLTLVFASYFPRGQKQFRDIKKKFGNDLKGVAKNKADGLVFVTNQELTLGNRKTLQNTTKEAVIELYHLERLTSLLSTPKNYGIRLEFLEIRPTDAEYLAFLAIRDEEHYRRLREVNGNLTLLLRRMEEQTADLIGYATGGDSIAYFMPMCMGGSQVVGLHLFNDSKYPVFDIQGYYVDLDEPIDMPAGRFFTKHQFFLPHLYPHFSTAQPLVVLDMNGRDRFHINVFMHTRTKSIRQFFRVFRGADHFIIADKTEAETGFARVNVPPSVPGYDPADPEAVFHPKGSSQPAAS